MHMYIHVLQLLPQKFSDRMSDSTELTEQVHFEPEADGRDQCVNDGRDFAKSRGQQEPSGQGRLAAISLERMTSGNTEMTYNRIIER